MAINILTKREFEVMTHIADGYSNVEIGELLGISHRTVEIHRRKVYLKTGVKGIAELTKYIVSSNIGKRFDEEIHILHQLLEEEEQYPKQHADIREQISAVEQLKEKILKEVKYG